MKRTRGLVDEGGFMMGRSRGKLLLLAGIAFLALTSLISVASCNNESATSESPSARNELDTSSLPAGEVHSFQAEVSRLMDIIINSLYSRKEIFLRELISNSADALEKTRFLSLSDSSIMNAQPKLEIQIETNDTEKTLTIRDFGVGMTKQELIDNLGTVARSGTTNFLEAVAQGADVNLIGQFGVGFYAAFLVADRVTVASKSASGEEQHLWVSSADAKFTVAPDPRGDTLGRGTEVTLHLKPDSVQFLEIPEIKRWVEKFNQFVNFPIMVRQPKPSSGAAAKESDSDDAEEIGDEEKTETKATDAVVEFEWVQVNKQKPLWMRNKDELKEADYEELYRSMFRDWDSPLAYIHFNAEGEVEFKSILFIPRHSPVDAWASYFAAKQDSIRLYARRVLVADEVYELLPRWLNFIKGVVDSDDLPLKIDRETLSQTTVMKIISKKVVAKFLELVKKMSKEDRSEWAVYRKKVEDAKAEGDEGAAANLTTPDTKFMQFYKNFDKTLKIGCVEDDSNRERIVALLRYHTTNTGLNDSLTLDEYVEQMPDEQRSIYYIASDDFSQALSSPHMQYYKQKGFQVLVLPDPHDEPCFQRLHSHKGKILSSIEKVHTILDATEEQKAERRKLRKAFKPVTTYLSKKLKGKVARVQISDQLVDDVVALKVESFGASAFGQRILRAQAFRGEDLSGAQYRILEVNPRHPLLKKLLTLVKDDETDPRAEEAADMLHDLALLNSGYHIDHPTRLARSLTKFVQTQLGVPEDAIPQDFDTSDIKDDAPEKDATTSAEDIGLGEDDFDEDGKASPSRAQVEELLAQYRKEHGIEGEAKAVEKADDKATSDHDEL